MHRSQKQAGGAVVVVVILISLAILGVLGYVVWNNFFNPQNNTQQAVFDAGSDDESPAQDANEGHIVLNDWGIRFKASDSLSATEVLYYLRSTEDSPSYEYYAFTTSRIRSLEGKCTERQFGDTAILYRYQEKPIATPDGELVNEIPLNGYYYVLTSPIASCSGFNENDEMQEPSSIEMNDRAALKESIRKLELIK